MVLIISENNDWSTNHVIDWLLLYKYPFVRINENDSIVVEEIKISSDNLYVRLLCNNQSFSFEEIKSVWYRRGFLNLNVNTNASEIINLFPNIWGQIMNHLNDEKVSIIHFLDLLIQKKKHINTPNFPNVNKLIVLLEAAKVGLKIPDTKILGEKNKLTKKDISNFITKSISNNPILFDKKRNVEYYNTTNRLQNFEVFPGVFFPSLFQKEIRKIIEIRVFFLFGNFYSQAIFSQKHETTKLDYRNDNKTITRHCPFNLPKAIENKLLLLACKLKITCGSVDLILGTDNHYYFLELNPIGQFGNLSYVCNYKIEKLIAEQLINEKNIFAK